MKPWWYSQGEKQIGPVGLEEFRELLETGRVSRTTLVWRTGMDAWVPLADIEELRALSPEVPPPLPKKYCPHPSTYPLAGRWRRFFARIVDLWWEVAVVSFVLAFFLSQYSAAFVRFTMEPGAFQLLGIVCIPLALVIDATLYGLFSNTPGKFLLGLKVTALDGGRLTFLQYLRRNFSLWGSGLAFGIPIFNLFTMGGQHGSLGRGGQASYDEGPAYRVRLKPWGPTKTWAGSVTALLLFMGLFTLEAAEKVANRQQVFSPSEYAWTNPRTGATANIDGHWAHTTTKNAANQEIYRFTESAGKAVVILGVENWPGHSLNDYVAGFRKGTAGDMEFYGSGAFSERAGYPCWEGTGAIKADATNRLKVEIVEISNSFWRTVTIQAKPYDYSDELVQTLRNNLWTTAVSQSSQGH